MARTTKITTTYTCDRCKKQTEFVETPTGLSSVGGWIEIVQESETLDICDECVEFYGDFLAERMSMAQQLQIIEAIKETLDNPTAAQESDWTAGEYVEKGFIRNYSGQGYECIQSHVTQPGWEPLFALALWKTYTPEGVISEWKQPTGAHDAYAKGAKVTHKGAVWVSTADNNVWEPGVYGWTAL